MTAQKIRTRHRMTQHEKRVYLLCLVLLTVPGYCLGLAALIAWKLKQ